METFEEKVERYMKCDKRTLAELLAMKELVDSSQPNINELRPIDPYYYDYKIDPNIVWPTRTVPMPPNYGDWIVTCMV